jgi:CubicO group peptidase (beta-lactamase class C family)
MPTRFGVARFCACFAACALLVPAAGAQDASPSPAPSGSATPVANAAAPGGRYQAAVARIAQDAPEAMRRQHAPGMALALTDRSGTIAVLTFGLADVEKNEPVTPRTRFGIGSITKSMTSIALLQARDRGAFDPRAPVTRYLPWFSVRSRWRALTSRDLLTHTSGLPDGVVGAGAPYDVLALRDVQTGFAPGTQWSYSNIGYETLGEIVAAVDHRPWSDAVRAGVLERVGMTASFTDWTLGTLAGSATGYLPRYDDRIPDPRAWDLVPVPPSEFVDAAGSVLSTAGDMAKYARMILRGGIADGGVRVLSPSSYALLTTAAAKAGTGGVPELYERYAYGLAVHNVSGDRIVGHTGGTGPYTACMEADLTQAFAAVALTNIGYGTERPCAIVEDALRVLRAARRGAAFPTFPAATDPAQVKRARAYTGTYRAANGAELTVVAPRRDRLALVANGEQHPLLPVGGGIFWTDIPRWQLSGLRFVPDRATNRATALVAGGRWYQTAAYRGPSASRVRAAWRTYLGHYRSLGGRPYDPSIRVQLVHGSLELDDGTPLVPLPDGSFRMGSPASGVLRVRFDAVVDGHAQRATFDAAVADSHAEHPSLTAQSLYRVTTP